MYRQLPNTLTVLRLVLAHLRRLPYWMLFASVVVDMTLLLGLIWSFHLQYEQPASFYLKAPTLLYVFIFIALRALRFEAGFVVLSGLVAALGCIMQWSAAQIVFCINVGTFRKQHLDHRDVPIRRAQVQWCNG